MPEVRERRYLLPGVLILLGSAGLAALAMHARAQEPSPTTAPMAASAPLSPTTARLYASVLESLVTVEVHSGNRDAKSALGSGYVAAPGRLVTNYHVISSFVSEPERYHIRVRGTKGEAPATLLAFDMENDLAVLAVPGFSGRPLPLAGEPPPTGSSIVALGNPHGLGLSLIEGIFNGFAAKGAVQRMLLSMPLNSGMSGGPILDREGRVIGTNVSVMYLSNSLSFGVPVSRVGPLLAKPPVERSRSALRQEMTRQLSLVEGTMAGGVVKAYVEGPAEMVGVGGIETRRPPAVFECWDDTDVYAEQKITKARFGCDLEFTPSIEDVGPVGAITLLVEHFTSGAPRYGFYDHLEDHGAAHLEVEARDPDGGTLTAAHCVRDRVRAGQAVWKINTCTSALVAHPGFFNYDLVATTVDRPRSAAFVAVHMKGVRPASFVSFAQRALTSVQFRVP
jgi:serine protease Do